MKVVNLILIGFVAFEHLAFLWLEMFAWKTRGPKVFRGYRKDFFQETSVLAANQGLYNGFLAAGLIWSLFIEDNIWQTNVSLFFLICVLVAGVYGGFTASKKIFYIQALPAIIAIQLILST